MKKYTGDALTEMRALIALTDGQRSVIREEQAFLADMKRKAARSVMMLTPKQDEWLLNIIDRVVTDRGLYGKR